MEPETIEVVLSFDGDLYPVDVDPNDLSYQSFTRDVAEALDLSSPEAMVISFHRGENDLVVNRKTALHKKIVDEGVRSFLVKRKDAAIKPIEPTAAATTAANAFSKIITVERKLPSGRSVNYRVPVSAEDFSKEKFVSHCADVVGIEHSPKLLLFVMDPADRKVYFLTKDNIEHELRNEFSFILELAEEEPSPESDRDEDIEGIQEQSWRECIQPSWICASDAQTHHFFLSHRQYSEAQFVDKIYGRLNGQYHPFWDQMCIKEGQRWVSEFITGLFCSRIAVLFCSEEAMKKFHRAEKQPDNFLLEWELCLEIVESKETPLQIFVVFVGQVEEVVGRKSGLSQIDLRSFNFEAFGANNFSEGKHCHPLSPRKYTIRQIVEKIFEFQGLPGDPRPGKSNMLVDALLKSAAKLTAPPTGEVVLSAKSESALFRELRQWLHPLDMAMRHHKDRLLDKHVVGTRKWLLDKLTEDLFSVDRPDERVFWLHGVAGVGKSVMAALVAQYYEQRNQLAGMFFCKHDDDDRRDVRNMVLTIAYFLADWNSAYSQSLYRIKHSTPDLLSKPVDVVFRTLITEPLGRLNSKNHIDKPIVIIIDALDECGDIGERADALQLFSSDCRSLPPFVKIFLTSRPEPDIVDAFKDMSPTILKPSDEENRQDLMLYAEHFLESNHSNSEVQAFGPQILVDKSEGVFIWMVLACETLLAEASSAGESRGIQLSAIEGLDKIGSGEAEAASKIDHMLTATFTRIFKNADASSVPRLQMVLAVLIVGREPLTAMDWALLLKEDIDSVLICFRWLQSVILVDEETSHVRFFHKSVADFLSDATRCTNPLFYVGKEKQRETAILLGLRSLDAMIEGLKLNILNLDMQSLHDANFFARVNDVKLPEPLRYACVNMAFHIRDGHILVNGIASELVPKLKTVVERHLTHWMEMLSCSSKFDLFISHMDILQWILTTLNCALNDTSIESVIALINEGRRFAVTFRSPICFNPFHIYQCVQIWTPRKSLFYKFYSSQLTPSAQLLSIPSGPEFDHWPERLCTLEGHTGTISDVHFCGDELVVSASQDRTARLWNRQTGQEIRRFDHHTVLLFCASVSTNKKLLATGSSGKTVIISDIATGRLTRKLKRQSGISALQFSPDSKSLAIGAYNGSICIYNLDSETRMELNGVTKQVTRLHYDMLGSILISASADNTVRFWNPIDGSQIKPPLEVPMVSFAVTSDCNIFATATEDFLIHVWDARNVKVIHTLKGHEMGVKDICFSPDGKLLATASLDRTVRYWEVQSGAEVKRLHMTNEAPACIAFSESGKFLAIGMWDMKIEIWGTAIGRNEVFVPPTPRYMTTRNAALSPDGSLILVASEKVVQMWDVATATKCGVLEGHSDFVRWIAFSRDGKLVVTASQDCSLRTWDVQTRKEVACFTGHTGPVWTAEFSPDGLTVASGGEDKAIRVWNATTGHVIMSMNKSNATVRCLAFSPDGSLILFGNFSFEVCLWRLASGKVKILGRHKHWILAVSFSPDGKWMASSSRDRTTRIYDGDRYDVKFKEIRNTSWTEYNKFSPDSKMIITASRYDYIIHELHKLSPNLPRAQKKAAAAAGTGDNDDDAGSVDLESVLSDSTADPATAAADGGTATATETGTAVTEMAEPGRASRQRSGAGDFALQYAGGWITGLDRTTDRRCWVPPFAHGRFFCAGATCAMLLEEGELVFLRLAAR